MSARPVGTYGGRDTYQLSSGVHLSIDGVRRHVMLARHVPSPPPEPPPRHLLVDGEVER